MTTHRPEALGNAFHLDALFDKALDCVVGMDGDGNVIAWNPSAEETFGWTAPEAIGARMSDLIVPPQHRGPHEAGLKRFHETGEGPVLNARIKITALCKSGREIPIELSILPIYGASGTVFYAFIRSLEDEARTTRERELRAREAEVVAAVSAAHLKDISTEDFIRLCLEKICHVSGWAVGHYYKFDNPERPSRLLPSRVWYVGDPAYVAAQAITEEYVFAKGEGLPGQAWETEGVVLMENLRTETNFSRREPFVEIGLTRGLAFPLRNRGTLSGVMEFFGPDTARPDTETITFAEMIGTHVELALQRKIDNDERRLLQREVSHRIGNSLAILASLFRRCAADARSVDELRARFEPRLHAIGQAHRMVASGEHAGTDLRDIVDGAAELLPESERIAIDGPSVNLGNRPVMPLTVVLHELVTNTLKYGRWHESGRLRVTWRVAGDGLVELIWQERPAGGDASALDEGYGTLLMQAMIEGTLNGRIERRVADGAFEVELRFPLGA